MATTATKTNGRSTRGDARGREHVETVIIGGGQAGLATGYHLKKRGRPCVILDANERIGDSWRKRWPSLRLYSPARYDALPGLPFQAAPLSFPTTNEMADYLEDYADRFDLPVRTGVRVDGLDRTEAAYLVTADGHCFEADNVVIATGTFTEPVVPEFADELDPEITQLHSADYRSPAQLQAGPVLVVGAAHSGADIAYEVAGEHQTLLSGRDTGALPFRVDGSAARVLWPVMRFLATRVLTVRTPMGRKARSKVRRHGGPLLRVMSDDLERAGVERVGRTAGVEDGMPVLEDGRVADVRNVIWCTGFGNDYRWIRFPLPLRDDGFPEQDRGAVESLPGLYFVGMLFLHSFASMLILGAGRDGERVAKHIASHRAAQPSGRS